MISTNQGFRFLKRTANKKTRIGAIYCSTIAVPAVVSLIAITYRMLVALIMTAASTFVRVKRRRKLRFTANSMSREMMLRTAMIDIAPQEMDLTQTPVSPHRSAVHRISMRPVAFSFLFVSDIRSDYK